MRGQGDYGLWIQIGVTDGVFMLLQFLALINRV